MNLRLILVLLTIELVSSIVPKAEHVKFFQNTFLKKSDNFYSKLHTTSKDLVKESVKPSIDFDINKHVLPKERMLLFFAANEARKAKKVYKIDLKLNVEDVLSGFFGPNAGSIVSYITNTLQQTDFSDTTTALSNLIESARYYCDLQPFKTAEGTRIEREQLLLLGAEAFATIIVTLEDKELRSQILRALLINFSLLPGSVDWVSTDWILGSEDYEWKLFDRKYMIDSIRLLKKWISADFLKRRSRRLLENLSDEAVSSLFQTILVPLVWATPSTGTSAAVEWMEKRVQRRSYECKALSVLVEWVKKNFKKDELICFLESSSSLLPEISKMDHLTRIHKDSLYKLGVIAINRLRFKLKAGFANSPYVYFKPRELLPLGFSGGYISLYPTRTCLIQMLIHPDNFNYPGDNLQENLIIKYKMQGQLSKMPLETLYNMVQQSLSLETGKKIFEGKNRNLQLDLIENMFERVRGEVVDGIKGPIHSMQQIHLADDETVNRVEARLFELLEADPRTSIIEADNLTDIGIPPELVKEFAPLVLPDPSVVEGSSSFRLHALPETQTHSIVRLGNVNEWQKLLNPSLSYVAEKLVGPEPTTIQQEAIPLILKGKNVFICGGYGKTLAALLPFVQKLKDDERVDWTVREKRKPRMLVLVPTRELCSEILISCKNIGHVEKISTEGLAGGRWFGKQRKDNNKLIDIVVGTPSRILRHSLTKHNIRLDNVKYVVIDEVDEIIAGGYFDELEPLIKMLPPFQLAALAPWNAYQHPKFIELTGKLNKYFEGLSLVYDNTLHKGPSGALHQFLKREKRGGRDKLGVLLDELRWGRFKYEEGQKYIVFCNTVSSCRAVQHSLKESGFNALSLWAKVPVMERKANYEKFCNEGGILVTTQARGLNFYGDNRNPINVINFDFPKSWIDYVIRSNRCRGFDGGRVTSLIDSKSKYLALGISRSIKADLPLKGLSRHKRAYNPLTGRLRYLTQSGGYFKILAEIRRCEIEGDGRFDIYKIISNLHSKETNPAKRRSVRLSIDHEYRRRRKLFRVLLHKLKLVKRWNRAIRLKHKLLNKGQLLGWRRVKFPSMKKEAPIRKAMARVIQHLGTNYNYKTHERNLMLTRKLVKKHIKINRHLMAMLRQHKLDKPSTYQEYHPPSFKYLFNLRKKNVKRICALV